MTWLKSGKGTLRNDALRQVVSLTLLRWRCAIGEGVGSAWAGSCEDARGEAGIRGGASPYSPARFCSGVAVLGWVFDFDLIFLI